MTPKAKSLLQSPSVWSRWNISFLRAGRPQHDLTIKSDTRQHSQLLPCFVEVILLPGRTLIFTHIIGPCCGGDTTDKLVIWKHRIGQAEWKIKCLHIAMKCKPASKSQKSGLDFENITCPPGCWRPIGWLLPPLAENRDPRRRRVRTSGRSSSVLRRFKPLSQLSLTRSASCKGPATVRTPLDKN